VTPEVLTPRAAEIKEAVAALSLGRMPKPETEVKLPDELFDVPVPVLAACVAFMVKLPLV
jgi:hypothetical protein